MARYYNRSGGLLPLSLPKGKSVTVPGRSWIELTGEEETCASVTRALRKGFLYRAPVVEGATQESVKPV